MTEVAALGEGVGGGRGLRAVLHTTALGTHARELRVRPVRLFGRTAALGRPLDTGPGSFGAARVSHGSAIFRRAGATGVDRWALADIAASLACALEDVEGPLLGIITAGPHGLAGRACIGPLQPTSLTDLQALRGLARGARGGFLHTFAERATLLAVGVCEGIL